MRKIPSTMATQHPDNASAPYWDGLGDPFISTQKEIDDCLACYADLSIPEYMWDWEGKHADAAVIDKLFTAHYEYFAQAGLGKDVFLTFRVPNIWEEKGYNLLQALSVILSGEDFSRDLNFGQRPLFEVILPMTENAGQLMHIHKLFQKLAQFKSSEFTPDQKDNTDYLEVIPLVESIESQRGVRHLLNEYVSLHQMHYGRKPEYIRPFFARSDPALVSGMIATVTANKLAIFEAYRFSDEHDIPVYPIAGVGSLPFRGGLTPDTSKEYAAEYAGIRTASIQSSYRYDYPIKKVRSGLEQLEKLLPDGRPPTYSDQTLRDLENISRRSALAYQSRLARLIPDMQPIFAAVPKRRERRQHIGLLAYGRSMGNQKLPRAITFTAGFYSIGVPPEFIGMAGALKEMSESELATLRKEYGSMRSDLERAGRFINRDNLDTLAKRNPAWREIRSDIEAVEEFLGFRFQPKTHDEKAHANLTSNVLLMKNSPNNLNSLIGQTAKLRRSLG